MEPTPITSREIRGYIETKLAQVRNFSFSLTTKKRSKQSNNIVHIFQVFYLDKLPIIWYQSIRYTRSALDTNKYILVSDKEEVVNKQFCLDMLELDNITDIDIFTARDIHKHRYPSLLPEDISVEAKDILDKTFNKLRKRYQKSRTWKRLIRLYLYISASTLSEEARKVWKEIDSNLSSVLREGFLPEQDCGEDKDTILHELMKLYTLVRGSL